MIQCDNSICTKRLFSISSYSNWEMSRIYSKYFRYQAADKLTILGLG